MNEATADFIRAHADDDVRRVALKGTKDPDVDLTFALDQIAGRQTARRKLPSWVAADGVVFPPHLSMEQCSSELTARYKRQMMDGGKQMMDGGRQMMDGGKRMVDLTGGFGVDFSFMAPAFDEAVYVEQQAALCEIARHNFETLGVRAEVVCNDAVEYLRQMPHANLIYLDPARRDDHGQRTYDISDCTPDVIALRDLLLEKADRVVIKLSPMLDWRKAVADLGPSFVSEVHIVSVQNECKELLVVLGIRGYEGVEVRALDLCSLAKQELLVRCVNILSDGSVRSFDVTAPVSSSVPSSPSSSCVPFLRLADARISGIAERVASGQRSSGRGIGGGSFFLYEPNASIMKAGCFAEVAETFGLSQLAPNSHLFMSDSPVDHFPGRSFEVERVSTMNKRELREALSGLTQANITVRNFPLTVVLLRQRLKLREGGSTYIFATTLADKSHVLLICRKLTSDD